MILTEAKTSEKPKGITMEVVYRYFNTSRQGYAQQVKRRKAEDEFFHLMSEEVIEYRSNVDCRAGSRSLYYNLSIKEKYSIGVTKFEQLMSKHEMTIRVVKVRIVTTKSDFRSWNYTNLIQGRVLTGVNQAICGDITYLKVDLEVYYIFTLFDLFSGKCVGLYGSKRMRKQEAMKTLEQFRKLRSANEIEGCAHHTDGGSQYFSNSYRKMVGDSKMKISVAKTCLENGFAEQKNAILKHHFLPTKNSGSESKIQKSLITVKEDYNNRKQYGLRWLSPNEVEQQLKTGELKDKKRHMASFE